MKSVRAVITGKVQGVWFRAWTAEQAGQRGLSGWVRNRRDGSVEAVFSGAADAVDAMLSACREGPPLARVDGIETEDTDRPAGDGFEKRPTV